MQDRRSFLIAGLGGAAGLLAGCATPSAASRSGGTRAALSTAPVRGRVSVINGAPGNVVMLDTGEGLLLVDSGSAALASALRKQLADQRVHTLFNTHYHADQTGGNSLFAKSGTEIHAHVITKQWLASDYYVPADDRWVKAPPKEAVPSVTFRGKGELKAGPETVEFGYLLEAHTRGDAYVLFRDANVLAAGDVVSPLRDPVLDWFAGGWLGGRADAMDELLKVANEQTLVVPAYGKVMTYAELKAERDLMVKLYDRCAELTHKGNSAQDMLDRGALKDVGRVFQDPYKFLYDAAKGFQAHYTNFGGNVV